MKHIKEVYESVSGIARSKMEGALEKITFGPLCKCKRHSISLLKISNQTNPQGPIMLMYYFGPRIITTKHEQPSCPREALHPSSQGHLLFQLANKLPTHGFSTVTPCNYYENHYASCESILVLCF